MADFTETERSILDDFYWLRFLELETRAEAKRRESVIYKKLEKVGQSIFTVTKRLRKEDESGDFGFEKYIAWTKPCVISKIEKDSPADQCHLEPGDFIVFIDKANVVDVPRSEILDRISSSDVLTLEIFRRASAKASPKVLPIIANTETKVVINRKLTSVHEDSIETFEEKPEKPTEVVYAEVRKNRLMSKSSTESKKKIQLVTFSKDESTTTSDSYDSQRATKMLGNILQSERQFIESLNFGANRYINSLRTRKDLLSSKEHEAFFKSIEGIHEIMETISQRETPELIVQAYRKNIKRFIEEYEKYFASIKTVDNIIVEKTHHPEFIKFIANPPIPSSQPTFHNFLQKPLEYFNNFQKNLQILMGQYRVDCQEYEDTRQLINQLQVSYNSAMAKAAVQPKVEAKPLLSSLESRLVFTKCKPFKLDVPGRQWIFGGDLKRIEGNSVEIPTYTLLFNDIILFSTINRDRVMFITEEPICLKSVVESFFNIRKKETEFRLTIETNPNFKETSPTTHCTPDLIKSPLRHSKRRNIYLRAPSEEIKKVWQNLITQQVFNINSISPNSNHVDANVSLLIKAPSTQTDNNLTNVSTKNTKETESICSSYRQNNIYAHANSSQLNLKSQNAFDLGDSLDKIILADQQDVDEARLETPDTPSCANLSSLNGKMQKSMSNMSNISFSSLKTINSDCGESCGDIFNDFDSSDVSYANEVKESIFLQNDPFYVDN